MLMNPVWCATCNKPVGDIEIARDVARLSTMIISRCHDAVEEQWITDEARRCGFDWSRLTAFQPESDNLPED